VDNIPKNFKLQPLNGLEIKTWTGDILDTHLQDFQRMLISIAMNKTDDVRNLTKTIKSQLGNYTNNNPIYKKINI
jgi:CTD small phosphatase-like protein 2